MSERGGWERDQIRNRIHSDTVEYVVKTDRVAVVLIGSPLTGRLVSSDVHLYYGGDPEVASDDACNHLAGKPCLMESTLDAGIEIWLKFGPEPTGEEFWGAMERLGAAWNG